MKQWSLRITAYADRLISGLENVDWSDSIKDMQKNWIGKSSGCSISFLVADMNHTIEVFTTRPDTIFAVNFLVLAPEHNLISDLTTVDQKKAVEAYVRNTKLKSERDRQSAKSVSGIFTGSYATHPFSGEKIAIWIGEYVLSTYGTGAVMGVPCGDQRDWDFAKHFNLDIINIFDSVDISEGANEDKNSTITASEFLNGLKGNEAINLAIKKIEEGGFGKAKINYRLRDAIFCRQRYWGEPFPVYYKDDIPYVLEDSTVVTLPPVDEYLPTSIGEPPLARAKKKTGIFLKETKWKQTLCLVGQEVPGIF